MTSLWTLLLAALVAFQLPAMASSRAELDQLVLQLQANPNDNTLRERVIRMAQEVKPPPAIPEEARQHFIEGTTIAKSARDASQQRLAIESFNRALRLAPWWGDAYYNLAVAQELAGDLDGAQSSLRFYILTKPTEKEAREAQDRIYSLNAKKRLAESGAGSAPSSAVDPAKARELQIIDALNGARFVYVQNGPWFQRKDILEIRGRKISFGQINVYNNSDDQRGVPPPGVYIELCTVPLNGLTFTLSDRCGSDTGTISSDGQSVTLTKQWGPEVDMPSYAPRVRVFTRER